MRSADTAGARTLKALGSFKKISEVRIHAVILYKLIGSNSSWYKMIPSKGDIFSPPLYCSRETESGGRNFVNLHLVYFDDVKMLALFSMFPRALIL